MNKSKASFERKIRMSAEVNALNLFNAAATRVPAYKDFLKKNNIDPTKVKSIRDFVVLPILDKQNYILEYPREMLCFDGDFIQEGQVIATTSGTTGSPTIFAHYNVQVKMYVQYLEYFLEANFLISERKTLIIIGFPLGIWIGGVFTFEAVKMLQEKGYKVGIAAAGINKAEIVNVIESLGYNYEQIIIGSYAPFLKDIIDYSEKKGILPEKYNIGFMFAAEGFSEPFRQYIYTKTLKKNYYKFSLNIYGTVDIGTMAFETPATIFFRRNILKSLNESISTNLNADIMNHSPTICQYDPRLFFFEEQESSLLCTSQAGFPLIRYDLKDVGGLLSFNNFKRLFEVGGYSFFEVAQKFDFQESFMEWPVVYVYERADFALSWYAFTIYPSTLKAALNNKKLLGHISGRFTCRVVFDKEKNQKLQINLELLYGKIESIALLKEVQNTVLQYLLENHSEYRETYYSVGSEKLLPDIVFHNYESSPYFVRSGKQIWSIK